jgi:hypothetical protein
MVLLAELPKSAGIHLSNGTTACAIRPELVAPKFIDKHFTQDAARGIACAQDEYIHQFIRTMANRVSVT